MIAVVVLLLVVLGFRVVQSSSSSSSSSHLNSPSFHTRNPAIMESCPIVETTTASKPTTLKRSGYLCWEDYFMAMALLSAQRSKDPYEPKGACIVDEHNRIVGIGYNGFPRSCSDDWLPWTATSSSSSIPRLHTQDPYVVHAEVNAILNKCSENVRHCRMYVPYFPCNECAKLIIQAGITEIIYRNEGSPKTKEQEVHSHEEQYCASRILLTMAGVVTRKYIPQQDSIQISFPGSSSSSSALVSTMHVDEKSCNSVQEEEEENDTIRNLLWKEAMYIRTLSYNQKKRDDYLSWDDYFMAVAVLSSQRSKDPNTQVGACIVDTHKCILGIGYNGFPRGCSDDHLPWSRNATTTSLDTKYPYVVHAEVNSILNKCSKDVQGATLYVALFPCNECSKMIIQAGIAEVVYVNDMYHDTDACRASRIMFEMAGVKTRQYSPTIQHIRLCLSPEDIPPTV